jgi:hypothetical protein
VAAKSLAAQTAVVRPRAAALNRLTQLGMPDSYRAPPA